MRRILLGAAVFFMCAFAASAQNFTTVTGTITDTNGLPYSNASVTAEIQPAGTNPAVPPPCAGQTSTNCGISGLQRATADVNGTFSMTLASNAAIIPGGTQWKFTVTITPGIPPPAGTGSQSCFATLTISGASQSVTSSFSACPRLSSTSTASKFDTNGIYVATNCGNSANCFQVFADVQVTTNATYTNTSTTVTTLATDPAFVSTDVGKIEFGAGRCGGDVSRCFYDVPQGTISTVVSAHNVTVSLAATNTSTVGVNTNNFAWGHDDGTQLAAAFAALFPLSFNANQYLPQPQKSLFLPCGMMFTGLPPFVAPAITDTQGGGLSGCGGSGGTVIIPLPKMNCNSAGSAGCLFSNVTANQISNGLNLFGWTVRDLSFWGLGTDVKDAAATCNGNPGINTSFYDLLVNVSLVGFRWNFGCMNLGMNGTGSTWMNSNCIAAGASCAAMGGSSGTVGNIIGGTIGGAGAAAAQSFVPSGVVNTEGVYWNQSFNGVAIVPISGAFWTDHGSHVTGAYSSIAGATAYFHGTILDQFGGGSSTLTMTGGIVHLSGVRFLASGAAINQSGGTLYDDCGNGVLPGPTPTISNLFGSCSITGVADVLGNHVLTSGWGTSAVSAVTGSVNDVKFTITTTVAGAANPVLTDTFATPYWATPSGGCTLIQVGGTFGVITNPVPSALSRTGVTWTFAGTPTANTYIFVRHCANS